MTFKQHSREVMMRDITKKSLDAFFSGKEFTRDNTGVRITNDGLVVLYLHGNAIARRPVKGERIEVSAAGWATSTTKERLNGLMSRVGSNLWQEDFVWYYSAPYYKPSQVFNTKKGHWTVVREGSDLEQLADVKGDWNDY